MRLSFNQRMDSDHVASGLLSHLIHIAATSSTLPQLNSRLAAAIGSALGADGCVVVAFTLPLDTPVCCGWFADRGATPVECAPSGHHYLMHHSLHVPSPPTTPCGSSEPDRIALSHSAPSLLGFADSLWHHLQIPLPLSTTATVLELATQYQGCPNGRISLMRSPAHPWTPTEIETLEQVGQHLATTFSHLQTQQKMEHYLQYQSVVNQLTLAIRNNTELTDVIQFATQGLTQALRGVRGLLLRIRYADPLFRHHATAAIPKARVTVAYEWVDPEMEDIALTLDGAKLPSLIQQSFWLAECDVCRQVFHGSTAMQIADTRVGASLFPGDAFRAFFSLECLRSLVITPLSSQGTILGFLLVQSDRPRQWQPADTELIELVSAQLSHAIIQTETLRQVQSLVEKRTSELQQSLTVQAKLYDRTRQQLDQLRQLNHLKDEFLDTVSHELRTPLTSMALAIRMLKQVGLSSDRSQRYLDILEQQCAQETNLVNDLLALRELESDQVAMQREDVNLLDLVLEIVPAFQSGWQLEGLSLHLDYPPQPLHVVSDRASLQRIIVELLTNAGKYSSPNSCIQLKLLYREEMPQPQAIISLTNVGSAIFPDDLPYVFDKFRRCQGATQNAIQGTGLGLALVKSLVQHLNGTIAVASTPLPQSDEWETCFTLILPQNMSADTNA